MAPIVASTEISKPPDAVLEYFTDPSRLPEWQESVVSVQRSGPVSVGSRAVVTRKAGPRQIATTSEFTEHDPPRKWALRGVEGPVRGNVNGRIEPLDDGVRSRVTIELDLEGHGIGSCLSHWSCGGRHNANCPPACGG